MRVEHFTRQGDDQWLLSTYREPEAGALSLREL